MCTSKGRSFALALELDLMAPRPRRRLPGRADMESVIESQKQLLQLVQLCTTGPPERRPVFGAICRKLRAVQASAASMSRATPRSNVTSYRSALSSARSQLPSAHAVNLEQ